MSRNEWHTRHVHMTCDKCGDTHQDDGGLDNLLKGWRKLKLSKEATVGDPLGNEKNFDLCPGCSGMLASFLEIELKDEPIPQAAGAAGAAQGPSAGPYYVPAPSSLASAQLGAAQAVYKVAAAASIGRGGLARALAQGKTP